MLVDALNEQGLYNEEYLRKLSQPQVESLIQHITSDKVSAYAESLICGATSGLLFFGVSGLSYHLVTRIVLPILNAMATAITPLIVEVFVEGASLTICLATIYAAVKFTYIIQELFTRMIAKFNAVKKHDLLLDQLKEYKYTLVTTSAI